MNFYPKLWNGTGPAHTVVLPPPPRPFITWLLSSSWKPISDLFSPRRCLCFHKIDVYNNESYLLKCPGFKDSNWWAFMCRYLKTVTQVEINFEPVRKCPVSPWTWIFHPEWQYLLWCLWAFICVYYLFYLSIITHFTFLYFLLLWTI